MKFKLVFEMQRTVGQLFINFLSHENAIRAINQKCIHWPSVGQNLIVTNLFK